MDGNAPVTLAMLRGIIEASTNKPSGELRPSLMLVAIDALLAGVPLRAERLSDEGGER